MRPPFPAAIDNTMRSSWKSCRRKSMIRHLLNWQKPSPSIHLLAGQAFAAGLHATRLAFFRDGKTPDDAIAAGWQALHETYLEEVERLGPDNLPIEGQKDWRLPDTSSAPNKAPHRIGEALISYFDQYPLDQDDILPAVFHGQPAVEFNFGIPLPIQHPETGDPIIYCGRFDMLGQKDGQLFVVDEKTTSALGQYWATRYELSAQFTGYCWAAKQYGFPVVGAFIRGIGILSKEIKHAQLPIYRPDFMIEEWYHQLLIEVEEMKLIWESTDWEEQGLMNTKWTTYAPDFNDACGSYGGCEYSPICHIAPGSRDKLLAINFVQRPWDPLKLIEGE